ncbi:hypothetical protein CLOP_g5559 [Closterium sp. NIES-67]|nr:hypothetical protein CLOP_g5559 [Closterium sp. NIES-67]
MQPRNSTFPHQRCCRLSTVSTSAALPRFPPIPTTRPSLISWTTESPASSPSSGSRKAQQVRFSLNGASVCSGSGFSRGTVGAGSGACCGNSSQLRTSAIFRVSSSAQALSPLSSPASGGFLTAGNNGGAGGSPAHTQRSQRTGNGRTGVSQGGAGAPNRAFIRGMGVGPGLRRAGGSGVGRRGGAREVGGRRRVVVRAVGPEVASNAVDVIGSLGLDTLTFLVATVIVIPAFKSLKISPILGFLLSGVALNELGLIRNITDVKALSELGILFLLFEMGLELSLERLRALAKFAFGMGLPQVLLTTLAFTLFELPIDNAIGTRALEFLFGAKADLVNIRSLDEAVVIGAALALSSSAFVLQLLSEKGELATRFGSATLGILLLQDIAVVPLLVILPILETGDFTDDSVFPLLAMEGAKSLLGLGVLLYTGRIALRRLFEFVAESRSSEAFIALCLLTVTGTALITSKLGFSDSLGAFLAGALLAETNYRTQVEADIRPFRGLLLGLFFVTTGSSIDLNLLASEWPNILALLTGLITIKAAIITALGPRVGLTLAESVRTGLLLSQGGEFAFVVFALANQLGVLPLELNRLLIIVVVLSMALTPFLDALGRRAAEYIEDNIEAKASAAAGAGGLGGGVAAAAARLGAGGNGAMAGGTSGADSSGESQSGGSHSNHFAGAEPIVILGFNQMGQVLANFLSTPLAAGSGGDAAGWPFISFDLNPKRVGLGASLGFPVLYGDGSRPAVLESAGIRRPKAFMVVYSSRTRSVASVERLKEAFPGVPLYARAVDAVHLSELRRAGATDVVLESAETGLRLGSMLLQDMGVMRDDVVFVRRLMRDAMDQRALSPSSQPSDLLSPRPLLDTLKETLGRRAIRPIEPAAAFSSSEQPRAAPSRGGTLPLLPKEEDESTATPRVAAAAFAAGTAEESRPAAESYPSAAAADGGMGRQERLSTAAAATTAAAPAMAATAAAVATAATAATTVGVLVASEAGRAAEGAGGEGEEDSQTENQVQTRVKARNTEIPSLDSPMDLDSVSLLLADAQAATDTMLQYFSDGEDFVDRKLELEASQQSQLSQQGQQSQQSTSSTVVPSLDSPGGMEEGFDGEGWQAGMDPMLVYFSDGEDFVDVKLELPQTGNFPRDK